MEVSEKGSHPAAGSTDRPLKVTGGIPAGYDQADMQEQVVLGTLQHLSKKGYKFQVYCTGASQPRSLGCTEDYVATVQNLPNNKVGSAQLVRPCSIVQLMPYGKRR